MVVNVHRLVPVLLAIALVLDIVVFFVLNLLLQIHVYLLLVKMVDNVHGMVQQ